MHDWIISSAKLHQSMEINLKAYKRHKLDFSEYNLGEIKAINKDALNSSVVEEIKELKKLYDEGVLTKEEFEKAKKKVLN